MHARLYLTVLFALCSALSFCQPHESLLDWYQSFFQQKKASADRELEVAKLNLEEAIGNQDAAAEAKFGKALGLLKLTKAHDYEAAMNYFLKSLRIEDSLSLNEEQIFTYLGIAQVFEEVGDYNKSAEFLEQAVQLNQPFNNFSVLVMILNKQGKINAVMGRTEAAFDNYELALNYLETIDQPAAKAEALFNKAHLHSGQGQHAKALELHKEALTIRRVLQDKKGEAQSLNDIGELYRLMKNDEKAFANHQVALDIRQRIKDTYGLAESYNNIGALYLARKDYEKAIANLLLARDAGRSINAQEQLVRSYEYLSLAYKAINEFQQALKSKEEYISLTELILNETNAQRLLESQNRYVIKQKESEIDNLKRIRAQREKELQEQKRFRNFLYAIIALGAVIVLLICYLYLMKQRSNRMLKIANDKVQKQNIELQDLNATKDKFFSIISHDLKGPLNSLTSFSSLLINHADSLSKDEIQMLAKDLDKSLKNLFALLENLLEWSRSQTGNIEFKPDVFDLHALLEINRELLKAQAQNKKITIVNNAAEGLSTNAHKHSVNTVIRNLISNAIKFTGEGGQIVLTAKKENEFVKVSVADNGVGMTKDIIDKLFRIDTKHSTRGTADEKGTGLGLILCKEFIEKNGGTIWVESEVGKGSVFSFTVPAAVSTLSDRPVNV